MSLDSRILYSDKFKTFHDFLLSYLKSAFGQAWRDDQASRPEQERHPLLGWVEYAAARMRASTKNEAQLTQTPMTAGLAALYKLAYDLYELEHNVELKEKLLNRLRS